MVTYEYDSLTDALAAERPAGGKRLGAFVEQLQNEHRRRARRPRPGGRRRVSAARDVVPL